MFGPCTDDSGRHLAFAVASQFGHAEMVKLLLDAGEDPTVTTQAEPMLIRRRCIKLHGPAMRASSGYWLNEAPDWM